jgi:type I restriction enzyme S subunit
VIGQDFEEAEVVIPTASVLEAFHHVVTDMLEAQQVLLIKNANLRRTRDLLLPRLVSGELDVSELEIAGVVEEEVV